MWDRGNGDTELPLPDAPGARGKLPRKLHSYLNLSKDQTARGEGSSQQLPALRTSSADREKRDLDRQGQRMTTATIPKHSRAGKGPLFSLPHPSGVAAAEKQMSEKIIVFHVPPASKVQETAELLSGSSQPLTELTFPARETFLQGRSPTLCWDLLSWAED